VRWNKAEAQRALADVGLQHFQVALDTLLGLPVQRVMRYRLVVMECGKKLMDDEPMKPQQVDDAVRDITLACQELNEESGTISKALQQVKQLSDFMGKGGAKLRRIANLDLVMPGRVWLK
jgi:hypothetical protein